MSGNAEPCATGGCLCGAVRFEVHGPLRAMTACHCSQCRRQTGHFFVSSDVARDALSFGTKDGLAWYRASDIAERGFCKVCGSMLFWSADDAETISIAAGALDPPTGLHIAKHIWVGDKSDYYDVPADVPIFEGDG